MSRKVGTKVLHLIAGEERIEKFGTSIEEVKKDVATLRLLRLQKQIEYSNIV